MCAGSCVETIFFIETYLLKPESGLVSMKVSERIEMIEMGLASVIKRLY